MEKKGPNGFLIGLAIGGAVGALISTKKGRQILKDLADYGLDYVGKTISMEDIENILNNDEEEMMAEEMDVKDSGKSEHPTPKVYTPKEDEPSRRRRLFRGIKKK